MVVLVADLAFTLDTIGPVDHQRIMLTAAMLTLLEIAERRVPGHSPPGVVVRKGRRISPARVIPHARLDGCLEPVAHVGLVEGAGESALSTGAVVGGDEDECVVQLANPFEVFEHTANLKVHMLHLRCEDFHLPCIELLFFIFE